MGVPIDSIRVTTGCRLHYNYPDPLSRSEGDLVADLIDNGLNASNVRWLVRHRKGSLYIILMYVLAHGPTFTRAAMMNPARGVIAIEAWEPPFNAVMQLILSGHFQAACMLAADKGMSIVQCTVGHFSCLDYALLACKCEPNNALFETIIANEPASNICRSFRIIAERPAEYILKCQPTLQALARAGYCVDPADTARVLQRLIATAATRKATPRLFMHIVELIVGCMASIRDCNLVLGPKTPVWVVHLVFWRFRDTFFDMSMCLFTMFSKSQLRLVCEATAVEYRQWWATPLDSVLLQDMLLELTASYQLSRRMVVHNSAHYRQAIALEQIAMSYLCSSLATSKQRLAPWSSSRHRAFPLHYKGMVTALFLSAARWHKLHTLDIPYDVLEHILSYCFRYDWCFQPYYSTV